MLFWDVEVEVGVGRCCECIAAPTPHTEQAGIKFDENIIFRLIPEELAKALCGEEFGRLEDCVLKKVGQPCCYCYCYPSQTFEPTLS